MAVSVVFRRRNWWTTTAVMWCCPTEDGIGRFGSGKVLSSQKGTMSMASSSEVKRDLSVSTGGPISAITGAGFIFRQAKSFFRVKHGNTSTENETTSEFRFQMFLVFMTCLLLSLLAFFYTEETVKEPLILRSHYYLVAIFLALCLSYFIIKAIIYTFVNSVFFDGASNTSWLKSLLFVTSVEGVLLFPIVLLLIYFNLPMKTVLICTAIVVISIKFLSFYKCNVTFFRHNDFILQNILYFCTLEIMPLFMLLGSMLMIVNNLKINY